MLKYTRVELELIDDIDMVNFMSRGIDGGIDQSSNYYYYLRFFDEPRA